MASSIAKKYGDRSPHVVQELHLGHMRSEKGMAQVFPMKRKKAGSRSWMRFNSSGLCELLELDRNAIMQRASIPARDLRILGPVFSQSSHILARERAIVVNLEFITAIVTAEELLLLDATSAAVVPFVEQLKEQFPLQNVSHLSQGEQHQFPLQRASHLSQAEQQLQQFALHSASHLPKGEQQLQQFPLQIASHISQAEQQLQQFSLQSVSHLSQGEQQMEQFPFQSAFHLSQEEQQLQQFSLQSVSHLSQGEQQMEQFPFQSASHLSPEEQQMEQFPLQSAPHLSQEEGQLEYGYVDVRSTLEAPLQSVSHLSQEEEQLESVHVDVISSPRDRVLDGQLVEWNPPEDFTKGQPGELPFEFRVLEIALDVVCNYLEDRVLDLELKAYPTLDEFTRSITSTNLELVRSLKSVTTHLTARVQRVRDELEQLLNDDDDMADLYLTRRKAAQDLHLNSPSVSFHGNPNAGQLGTFGSLGASKFTRITDQTPNGAPEAHLHSPATSLGENGGLFGTLGSIQAPKLTRATSIAASTVSLGNEGVEEIEMLLEAYFMQLDGALNKLAMVREYIADTEDYISIQLDHKRNQLFQFQLTLTAWMLGVGVGTAMCAAVSMNVNHQLPLYEKNGIFLPYVVATLTISFCVFSSVIVHVHRKGLFE